MSAVSIVIKKAFSLAQKNICDLFNFMCHHIMTKVIHLMMFHLQPL